MTKVLDRGYVDVFTVDGSEDLVSVIAGISHESESGPGVKKLLAWGHVSPLEFAHITFKIKMPIFVHRQFVRHRSIKIMERSMRYVVPAELDFYTTNISDKRVLQHLREAKYYYLDLLHNNYKPESARQVLPLCTYVEFYAQFDIRHLLDYLKLREDRHAQSEHQEYARAIRIEAHRYFPGVL